MGNQPSEQRDATVDVPIDSGTGSTSQTHELFEAAELDSFDDGGAIISLAVSPNLNHLASAERHVVRIWDLSAGEELAIFRTTAAEGRVTELRFTATGSHLIVSCNDTIVVCNINRMDPPTRYRSYAAPIAMFTLSPDQHTRKMITLCYSDSVHIHDFGTGGFCNALARTGHTTPKESHRAYNFEAIAHTAKFSPDSKYVAFGLSTGRLRVFTTNSNKELGKYTAHRQAILALDIAWGGVERKLMVASAGGDCCVRVHLLVSSELQFELDGHTRCVSAVAFSADGLSLASAGHDGTIAMWSMITGCQLWLFLGHHGPVNAIVFVPAIEEYLISGGDDRSIRLWNIQSGKQKGVF
eukprot:m.83198 g.83198  ORF g.83198 m.83198 type:complete len:354 (-) comp25604_c0_seq1:49-1110(-)